MRRWLFLAKQSAAAADVKIDLIQSVHVEGRVVDARNGKPVPEVSVGVTAQCDSGGGRRSSAPRPKLMAETGSGCRAVQTDCYICDHSVLNSDAARV